MSAKLRIVYWPVVLTAMLSGERAIPLAEDSVMFVSQSVERPVTGAVSAVGSRSAWVGLAYTEDGGASWRGWQPPPSDRRMFDSGAPPFAASTFFVTSERGWLSGLDSVWMTGDKGSTWHRQLPGRMQSMFLAGGSGWLAAGRGGAVLNYTSSDDGRSWRECGAPWEPTKVAPLGSASFVDAMNGWITVASFTARGLPNLGGVARTSDGGCTWRVLWWDSENVGESERLREVQFVDANRGWLSASYGRLFETADGGKTWKAVALPQNLRLESAYREDLRMGWILGSGTNGSGFYYTKDGGENWQGVLAREIRKDEGLARDIPKKWGAGFLRVLALQY